MKPGRMLRCRGLLRALQLAFTIWGAVTLVFFASRLIPTEPARLIAGSAADEATVRAVAQQYGFDQPLYVQYAAYLRGLATGDLGRSTMSGRAVTNEFADRAPASIELMLSAMIFSLIFSIAMALTAVRRPGGITDRVSDGIVYIGTALPPFLIGVLLLFIFYTLLNIAPAPMGRLSSQFDFAPRSGFLLAEGILRGRFDVVFSAFAHLVLPTLALGFSLFPQLLRVIKENARKAVEHPATRAAGRAGVRGLRYWLRYVLSLSAVPVLNLVAGSFGYLIGGAVVIEVVFSWNGLGSYVVKAVAAGDYYVIQGVVLIASAVYAGAYFVSDILSWRIDPRIVEESHA